MFVAVVLPMIAVVLPMVVVVVVEVPGVEAMVVVVWVVVVPNDLGNLDLHNLDAQPTHQSRILPYPLFPC